MSVVTGHPVMEIRDLRPAATVTMQPAEISTTGHGTDDRERSL